MSLFTKKQAVRLDAFCRDFFERNIMNPVIEGIDAGAAIVEVIKDNIVEVDSKFSDVAIQTFASEYVLLRFELFGLAWVHQFDERSAVAQSEYTKNYLHEKERDDIWDNLEFYNQVIARSSTLGRTPTKGFDRVYLVKVNTTRMDLFSKFHDEGYDPTVVARALNRLFTKDAWKKDTTAELLMFGICDHLGFGPNCEVYANQEAQFRFKAIIHGLYDGAIQALENIKIVDT